MKVSSRSSRLQPTRHSDSKLAPGAQALANAMIIQMGLERASRVLGTSDTTLEKLASGGCTKASTRDRIQARLVAMSKGVAA